jgi:hypothetical protein
MLATAYLAAFKLPLRLTTARPFSHRSARADLVAIEHFAMLIC